MREPSPLRSALHRQEVADPRLNEEALGELRHVPPGAKVRRAVLLRMRMEALHPPALRRAVGVHAVRELHEPAFAVLDPVHAQRAEDRQPFAEIL